MTKPAHREQVTNTASWMVQAGGGGGGGGGGGRGGMMEASVGGAGLPSSPDHLDTLAQVISQELFDDAILNVVFEVHQSVKTGLMMLELGAVEEEHKFLQVTAEGLDVFGQAPIKKQHECVCPSCSRNLAASRFAPHLEKCLGMGRNSSRIASRRIQNSTKENSGHHHSSAAASDDDDDDDWLVDRKRKKRDKNSPRRSKNAKLKLESGGGIGLSSLVGPGGGGGGVGAGASAETTLANGTAEEKRAMLRHICGVVSEHTHKMCTRSLRCPQHSHQQRQAVRDQVLNGQGSGGDLSRPSSQDGRGSGGGGGLTGDAEDIQVDIDGLDDGGHMVVSWDPDHSNTTSPADSTSTNNSTNSSTTLAKRSKTKKKSSKSSKSSSSSHGSLLD